MKPGSNTIKVDNPQPDVQPAGVGHHAGHGQRQEPVRALRDHAQGGVLARHPQAAATRNVHVSRGLRKLVQKCRVSV